MWPYFIWFLLPFVKLMKQINLFRLLMCMLPADVVHFGVCHIHVCGSCCSFCGSCCSFCGSLRLPQTGPFPLCYAPTIGFSENLVCMSCPKGSKDQHYLTRKTILRWHAQALGEFQPPEIPHLDQHPTLHGSVPPPQVPHMSLLQVGEDPAGSGAGPGLRPADNPLGSKVPANW